MGQVVTGITVVAPPKPIGSSAFERVAQTDARWICLVPYGFCKKDNPELRYNLERQWWGERKEGLVECIRHAASENLNVMLKPQVYMHGLWIGDMEYSTEDEWGQWEKNYEAFFDFYLQMAIDHDVDMYCIGTEFKKAVLQREAFWRKLIKKARKKYSGKLVYSANWDEYKYIKFWDELDYVGISAYFPLSDEKTPSISSLLKAWKPITKELEKFAKKYKKPILFTEYGYLSTDECAYRAWETEKKINKLNVNELAQANAFSALYQNFSSKSWWAGGFIWKWFPDNMGHEGYPAKDYTPQDKLAEQIVKKHYSVLNRR